MQFGFVTKTNKYIDELARIAWRSCDSHHDEYFRVPERDPNEVINLINDEIETEPEIDSPDPESSRSGPLDLTKFSQPESRDEKDLTNDTHPINNLLIAVDTGVANLGEFYGGGIAFAIRGSAICLMDGIILVFKYNTGPLLIDDKNSVPMFRYIGSRLGNEELYLARKESGELVPRPSAFETGNQLRDRCRNFVERMIHEEALSILSCNKRGVLIIDGALPAGTYDTPESYLQNMLRTAARNKVDIVAVSKKSRISIGGTPINALFDERPDFVGYVPLKDLLTEERRKLAEEGIARSASSITLANELFAVRFGLGPPALTFRVDVNNSIRSTSVEVLNYIYDGCQIQGCYPKPLIEAHQFSSFLFQDIQLFTADLVARTGARPKEDASMEWIFAPFGTFGK